MEEKKDGGTITQEELESGTYDATARGKRLLDPDVVKRMKEAGMQRPDDVSKNSWEQVQKVKVGRHTLVAHMAAAGLQPKEIAEAAGLTPSTVKRYLASPKIQMEVKRIQHKYLGTDPMRRFRQMMGRAADVMEETMEDPAVKPSVRLMAADKILDRAVGKPKQYIQMEGSLIRRVYEHLDSGKPIIDVPPSDSVRTVEEAPALSPVESEADAAKEDRWKNYFDENL